MLRIQLIPDIEDREFTSSSGHWTGDLNWSPDVLYGRQGYIYVDTPWPGSEKIISLSYPYVKPPKNVTMSMGFSLAQVLPYSGYVILDYYLTDGVYTLGPPSESYGFSPFWEDRGHLMVTPSGWNRPNSSLVVKIAPWPGNSGRIALRNFSLTYRPTPPTRPQYLPIIGVG